MLAQSTQTCFHKKITYLPVPTLHKRNTYEQPMNNFAQENNLQCCLDLAIWANIAQGNYLCNVGPQLTDIFSQQNNLYNVVSIKPGQHCIGILHTQCCPNTPETTSHKKITEAVAQSFFFYLGFLSRTFTNHRTAGKRGGHFFNSNSASTQTQTTPDSPISSEQPIDFIVNDTKDEEINNLNAEVKALKSFITEQLYV